MVISRVHDYQCKQVQFYFFLSSQAKIRVKYVNKHGLPQYHYWTSKSCLNRSPVNNRELRSVEVCGAYACEITWPFIEISKVETFHFSQGTDIYLRMTSDKHYPGEIG